MLKRSLLNATKVSLICYVVAVLFSSCFPSRATCILFGGSNCDQIRESPDGTVSQSPKYRTPRTKGSSRKTVSYPSTRGVIGFIEAGPSINFIKTDRSSDYYKSKPGLGFNFYFGSYWGGLAPNLYIHPSIGFKNARGVQELRYGGDGGPETVRRNISNYNFISMPVVAEYKVALNKLGLAVGPEIDYLISSSYKPDDGPREKTTNRSRRLGAGFNLGVNYRLPFYTNGRSRTGIQFNYYHRLSELNNKDRRVPEAERLRAVYLRLTYDLCGCN